PGLADAEADALLGVEILAPPDLDDQRDQAESHQRSRDRRCPLASGYTVEPVTESVELVEHQRSSPCALPGAGSSRYRGSSSLWANAMRYSAAAMVCLWVRPPSSRKASCTALSNARRTSPRIRTLLVRTFVSVSSAGLPALAAMGIPVVIRARVVASLLHVLDILNRVHLIGVWRRADLRLHTRPDRVQRLTLGTGIR